MNDKCRRKDDRPAKGVGRVTKRLPVLVIVLLAGSVVHAQGQTEATAYLDRALDILQQHFVSRDEVDWRSLRERAYSAARDAKDPSETYQAIRLALEIMGERHSRFMTPEERRLFRQGAGTSVGMSVLYPENVVARVFPNSPASRAGVLPGDVVLTVNGSTPQPNSPEDRLLSFTATSSFVLQLKRGEHAYEATLDRERVSINLPPRVLRFGKISYLELPGYVGDGQIEGLGTYGDVAQKAIAESDQSPSCGWVVDLRRNGGGNMWPMIVAAGPIVGEGNIGSYVVGQTRTSWSYRNGASYAGQEVASRLEGMSAYTLKNPKPSVAVLVSRITASSGEAALIAFIGRENTRTFGEPTNGLPTVNDLYELEDGAALVITESYMADRNGTTYDDIIRPDQEVVTDWANVGNDKDEALSTASRWLQDQPSCK